MTTTLIKKDNPSSKMNYFTGLESFNFKMVSILFIVVLNITQLSSQNNGSTFKSQPLIYPTSVYYKKQTANEPFVSFVSFVRQRSFVHPLCFTSGISGLSID